MKRFICLLLSFSLAAGIGLSAAAEQTAPEGTSASRDGGAAQDGSLSSGEPEGGPDQSSDALPPDSSGGAAAGSDAAPPESPAGGEGEPEGGSSSVQEEEETPSGAGQEGETPPDEGLLVIEGVDKTVSPSPMTAQGGSIKVTVRGRRLEKENVWVKLEKDGAPYQTVRCTEYDGLWETVKNELLSFAGQDVTQISTGELALTPGGPDSFAVYQVYVMHAPDGDTPADNDPDWVLWPDAGVVLPKPDNAAETPTVGGSSSASEDDSSGAPEESSAPDTGADENIGVDVPEDPEASSRPQEDEEPDIAPGGSEEIDPPSDAPSSGGEPADGENQEEEEPEAQKPLPQIGAVEASVAPDPLTYAGGGVSVSVSGDALDTGSVWVRLQADGQKAQVARAQGGGAEAAAPRFDLPENLSGKSVFYKVSVLTRADARKPAADDAGWRDAGLAAIEVPAANGAAPGGDDGQPFEIRSVQSVTVPGAMTCAGGSVTVAAAGTGLDQKNLWVRLDSGKETVTKKMAAAGSGAALSPEIELAANESAGSGVTYKVSLLAYDGIGTPGITATGWKRYSEADIVVPSVPAGQSPEIAEVTWEETRLDDGPAVVFHVTGRNLDSGENAAWIKAVPKDNPRSPKILRADTDVTSGSASTQPLSTRARKSISSRGKSPDEARYDVYALAKTTAGKPDADDKGWKRYGYAASLTPDAEPLVTRLTPDTAVLPSAGGQVRITVEGDNLDALSDEQFFVRLEKVSADGASQPMDKNVSGGKAIFDIPANSSPTHEETWRYSTYLKSDMREWGVITVSRGLGVKVETYSADGKPGPLTAQGGAVRCVVDGDSPGGTIWIKVSGNGREEIRYASETFAVDPNDSPTDQREIEVAMAVSPNKPRGYGKEWETLETLTLPAVNDGRPLASVSSVYIESTKIDSGGGKMTVTFEGENLDAQGLGVFARLAPLSDGDYPEIVSAASRSGEFRASSALVIPANTSPLARRYGLEYCLSYSEEPPAGAVWMTAAIPAESREVVVPRAVSEGTPFIESAALDGDANPISNTGGKITVNLYGKNLDQEHVWVNMRCAQDPARDDIRIADAPGPQAAATRFTAAGNDGAEQLSYRVYALTSQSDDVNTVAALGGWKEVAAFSQSPKTGEPKITQINVDASSVSGTEGTAGITVRGVNLKNHYLWAHIRPIEGSDADPRVMPLTRAGGTEDYSAAFPVEREDAEAAALYSASVLARSGKQQPEPEEFSGGASAVFSVGRLNTPPEAAASGILQKAELIPSEMEYDYESTDNSTYVLVTLGDSGNRDEEIWARLGEDGKAARLNSPSDKGTAYSAPLTIPKVDRPEGEDPKVVSYRLYVSVGNDGSWAAQDQEMKVTYMPEKTDSDEDDDFPQKEFTIVSVVPAKTELESGERAKITVTLGESNFYEYGGHVYVKVGKEGGPTMLEWEYITSQNPDDSRVFRYDMIPVPEQPGIYPVYVQLTTENFPASDLGEWEDFGIKGVNIHVTARSTSDEGGDSDSGGGSYDPNDTSGGSSGGGNANDDDDDDDGNSNVTGDDLDDAIDSSDANDHDEIIIDIYDDDLVVSRSFFERAEDCNKDIILRGDTYEWRIPAGSRMRGSIRRSYDLTVKVRDTRYENEKRDLAGADAEVLPFYIKYHGVLPCRMVLTLKDTDYNRRTDVWVYRYNVDSDSATLIAEETTGTDGNVSFYMSSCSYYFVSDQRVLNARRDAEDVDDYWFVDKEDLDAYPDDEDAWAGGKNNPGTGARAHGRVSV